MPGSRLERSFVVTPSDHANVFPVVTETVIEMAPLFCPQVAGVTDEVITGSIILSVIANDCVEEQAKASVTVTSYMPAESPCRSSVVAPFDQENV